MAKRNNVILPYTLGFAAVTAAAIIGVTSQQDLMPTALYDLKGGVEIVQRWEPQLTHTSFGSIDKSTIERFMEIKNFAEKLYDETTDIDPIIVKMVDENFWDLLA